MEPAPVARSLDQPELSNGDSRDSPQHSHYSNLSQSSSSVNSPIAASDSSSPSTSSSSAPHYSEDLRAAAAVQLKPPLKCAAALPPSKEEKQRQNEEIVCMETSTVSTETGSWESVYPQGGTVLGNGQSAPNDTLSNSACFIDASSLRDEDEVNSGFPSLEAAALPPPPELQLAQFHKAFAKCKAPQSAQQLASNSSSDAEQTPLDDDAQTDAHNLSDEEKLWQREQQPAKPVPVPRPLQQQFSVHALSSSPKFTPHQQQQDLSYTTDYSSSSPAHSSLICAPPAATETPHNSLMLHNTGSNHSSIHRDYTLSNSLSHQRDSGAYCSDATDSPQPLALPRTPKRGSRYDEANPIVSGGSAIEDYPKQCDSPSLKRRTEACPIVSGGFALTLPQDEQDEEQQVELRRKVLPSWVVDMSDCRSERRKSSSSSSSLELQQRTRERSDSNSSHKSGCGFYVSLEDMDRKPKEQLSKSYQSPKAANFFVNLSEAQPAPEPEPEPAADKKNIFSMFIDLGEPNKPRSAQRKEPFNLAQRLSSSLHVKREEQSPLKSSASSTETLMAKSQQQQQQSAQQASKSLDYSVNLEQAPAASPLAALRRLPRPLQEPSKRHSWGQEQQAPPPANDCKRSQSMSTNGPQHGLMSIIDKLPIISKASSLSVDSSLSPYDEYSGGALSSCSDEEQPLRGANRRHRRDAQLNETYDKSSSIASVLTEAALSKDLSPASQTDTEELTFQQDEQAALREVQQSQPQAQPLPLLAGNSRSTMETILEAKETASPKKLTNGHTMATLQARIEQQKQLLEDAGSAPPPAPSSFVKLSDMDKPLVKTEHMSRSAGQRESQLRGGSARPHSWAMTRSTGNGAGIQQFASSVDNLRSLSRLFPNFSKQCSNSLPGNMVLESDYIQTDLSADSSLASSFSRSGLDDSSLSCRQPRRLGEDLLKMFLQEIATDMLVEVHGRRIRAHKCILRSRCQYFAAMLAGAGAASAAQSVVSLQGYSYAAVHFALCHIYSGASHPPDGISLMELAALADLLGLEGLKEVTSHALKTNYCHNFHKPCSGCIDGILQVLPVALNHALDDLYRKCLRWTCRHYLKVWPTRQFAQLPPDILGRCRQQIVAYLTSETVLDTVLDCDHLLAQLSAYRWGHICEQLVRDILDAAYGYMGDHFASLIASDSFLSLGHDRSRHIPRLETLLLHTAGALTPEQACRSYQRVTRLNTLLQAKLIQMPVNLGELAKELQGLQEEQLDWQPEYIRLVSALVYAVEQCLIRQCARAMRITAWQRMDLELRKKVQTLARLSEPLDVKRAQAKPVGKVNSFGAGSTRSQELAQIKLAIQAQTKRATTQQSLPHEVETRERPEQRETGNKLMKSNTRAYVPQAQRASSQAATERHSYNLPRRTQSEAPKKSAPVNATVTVTTTVKPAAVAPVAAARLGEVRPRYLEPRKPRSAQPTNAASVGPQRSATSSSIPAARKAQAKKNLHISSSDSSRQSSPAAVRRLGNKSSNMSSDSLAKSGRYASDLRVDSLPESMKSSIITNKTISHESLSSNSKLARVQQLNGHGSNAKRMPNKSTRQLKQSNGSSPSSVQTTKSATSRHSSLRKPITNGSTTNGHAYKSTAQAVKQKLDLLIDAAETQPQSKLERSSTFCKDSADLDISELQIIE
ncbi:CG13917 [Drosophila busckii]|uniref:CG13917 n=1 Tax=Drosophila busckii TaxID=30019 RepID=A0A0M4EN77_DROBS|nr:CG13917 [Drosophila busckii]